VELRITNAILVGAKYKGKTTTITNVGPLFACLGNLPDIGTLAPESILSIKETDSERHKKKF